MEGETRPHHPRDPRRARGAGAPGAAAARAVRARTAGSPGQRDADHGRRARLDQEGVQAILNLVAAAVPGCGRRTSRSSTRAATCWPAPASRSARPPPRQSARKSAARTELRLSRAVEEMLERTLGAGRVRAEAAVRMDFDQVNETQENFDPDGQVTRSTQTVNANIARDRGEPDGHGAEQPAERRCRHAMAAGTQEAGRRRPPTTKSARPSAP